MSSKLKQIRQLIEDQVGFSLDLNTRKRDVVLARAVYYKVARDFRGERNQISLSDIGKELGKNHATVLHALNNVSFHIMDDEYYSDLYKIVMNEVSENVGAKRYMLASDDTHTRAVGLYLENVRLRKKLKDLVTYSDRFAQLTADLNDGQLDDVYDKVTLMVKVMNA